MFLFQRHTSSLRNQSFCSLMADHLRWQASNIFSKPLSLSFCTLIRNCRLKESSMDGPGNKFPFSEGWEELTSNTEFSDKGFPLNELRNMPLFERHVSSNHRIKLSLKLQEASSDATCHQTSTCYNGSELVNWIFFSWESTQHLLKQRGG